MKNFETWALIISGCAILISIISLVVSYNSNNRSEKIQELQSRPWLIASIHENDTTHRYYEIFEKDGKIYWQVEVVIENKGTSPANNIRIPQAIHVKDIKTTDERFAFNFENIVLGQGQKYIYNFKLAGSPKNPADLQKLLNQYKKNDKGLIFKFKVFYTGLIEQTKEYKSGYEFDVKSDKFNILSQSEYK